MTSPKLYALSPAASAANKAEKVAFVTHQRHVDSLRMSGELDQVLLASCDWLLWQQCLNKNLNCVSIEEQIYINPTEDYWQHDLLTEANSWVYNDATDMTMFHGASVGKLFNTPLAIALSTYLRMRDTVKFVIQRYQVSEIIFFDFRTETNILNDDLRQRIVCDLAAEHGVSVSLRNDPVARNDPMQAMIQEGQSANPRQSLISLLASKAMTFIVNSAGAWRDQKKRSLILIQNPMALPLLEMSNPSAVRPILLSELVPKNPKYWLKYIRAGVVFMRRQSSSLTEEETKSLVSNIQQLMPDQSVKLTSHENFLRAYVKSSIVDNGQFLEMARQVKGVAQQFKREKPSSILVDGVKNFPHRTYLDLCREIGCTSNYIWHAPLSSDRFGYDALGNDPRQPIIIDKMLAWGEMDQDWLKQLNVDLQCARTGAPHLKVMASGANETSLDTHPINRVLFLDCTAISTDLLAASATRYEFFVNVVHHLKKMGVSEIIYKLHPGRANKAYFEKIVAYFGLDCIVHKSEPIEEDTDWCDCVIGPVLSSAMMKVVARSKPYYPVLLKPTWTSDECYKRLSTNNTVEDLEASLLARRHAGGIEGLDYITSWKSIANPSAEIWNVLAS